MKLTKLNDCYYVTIRLNNTTEVLALIDTGASYCQIPKDIYDKLLKDHTASSKDVLGEVAVTFADNSSKTELKVNLYQVQLYTKIVYNVPCIITPVGSPILLGQSFLQKLDYFTIDNINQTIKFK